MHATGVAISIAGYPGLRPPAFVAQVVAFVFGLAASSLLPAILMGILVGYSALDTQRAVCSRYKTGVFCFRP